MPIKNRRGDVSSAQSTKSTFGWDLTYTSILEKNDIGPKDWIRNWLVTYHQSPAKDWITKWQGEPIISSILIEYPAFHAGERSTVWLVRTNSQAYYWESVQSDWYSVEKIAEHTHKKEIKPNAYDALFKIASSWEQAKPMNAKDTPADILPGYIGFLSFYDNGTSREMLLTFPDFVRLDTKEGEKDKRGRLMCALSPIILEKEIDEIPQCKNP